MTMNDTKVFGWVDYLLFAVVLAITALIGVYSAWKGARSSPSNYLTGNKELGIFPIGMSLAAGVLAATPLLGTPTDIYLTGTMHWWIIGAAFSAVPVISFLYLPVFYELQVASANQYLELRFNHIIRRFASVLYIIKEIFYLSIVVYGPSLALNQVTAIDVYVWVLVTFVVCTFYTSLGGFKAVIWTDTLQIFLVLGSVFTLLIKGVMDAGGLDVVWQRSFESSRVEFFNVNFDFTTRQTIWSTVIGGVFLWTSLQAVSQTAIQRYMAMPSIRHAHFANIANALAFSCIISLCCFLGVVVYARYHDCDPLTSKLIDKPDQIIPYYLMDVVGDFPGLPGLFMAGVFSGALAALSSGLNSIAMVVLEDFIRPFRPELQEKNAVRITKIVSLAVGCICFANVFFVSNVRTILDATLSVMGAYGGAILGVFTLGMAIPWSNAIGAGLGMVPSFILMIWLGIASQMAKSQGFVHNQMKSLSTENCTFIMNLTMPVSNSEPATEQNDFSVLVKISYLWYTCMGALIVLILGTLSSWISGAQDASLLDPRLVFRCLRNRVGKNRKDSMELTQEVQPLNASQV